jgi:putative restriction endonuclease
MNNLENQFASLNIWKSKGERAPHKPLLVLLTIGRYLRGDDRLIPYADIDVELKRLLMDFGPWRKSYHPELPYWHMQSDGLWEITNVAVPPGGIGGASAKRKLFLESESAGGFSEEIFLKLSADRNLAIQIAQSMLNAHFPETIHTDILDAVGIDLEVSAAKRPARDPKFRQLILQAYSYRCAICGFNSRLDTILVGVEAAHIKWHQAGGPDTPDNGLALCSLHHKLFDRGVITVMNSRRICVSEKANGDGIFNHLVIAFHGKMLTEPIRSTYYPADTSLKWHVKEVFQGPGRYLDYRRNSTHTGSSGKIVARRFGAEGRSK